MKLKVPPSYARFYANKHVLSCVIQTPLPFCLDTLPILVTIQGQGSGRQGPSPSAPPEEPTNDKP